LDCAGGDDVPRKGGPGVERADLLIINKVDLAPLVGADVELMVSDARERRGDRPLLAVSLRDPEHVSAAAAWVAGELARHRAGTLVPSDPGPMAPHVHGGGHAHGHDHAH
jgi:urease accessory protein